MKFSTIAEAFNFYKSHTNAQLEQRAAEINQQIENGTDIDIQALNIELTGIAEAKRNNDTKTEQPEKRAAFSLLGARDDKAVSLTRDNVYASDEYRSAFFKTLLGQKLTDAEKRAFDLGVELRAPAYNTSSNSAAVLPTQTLNEIIKKARTMGGVLPECRVFNLPTKVSVPVGTPGTKAAWHTEADEVEPVTASVSAVSFDGYELMKVFSISEKVSKMSVAAFEAYLIDELRDCVMETLDYTVINGSGSGQGTGIESGITWATTGTGKNHIQIATNGSFTYAKVIETVALLKRGYAAGAKWVMNNATLYNVFYSMADTTGRPIFIADPKDESIGKILGFPVVIDDNVADNTAYLGNFGKFYGYNMPEGIVVESSRESSFRRGIIDYRAMAIADCKPLVDEAFVKLSKASST